MFLRLQKRFIVDPRYKKKCLQTIGTCWRNFKSTLTREYILPNKEHPELLVNPPEKYDWLNRYDWSMFVKSRLTKDFMVCVFSS